MSGKICLNADFHVTFRYLLHAVKLRYRTDVFTSPPKKGVLRIFFALKIRRLRPGANPRTWVPKASTQPLEPPKLLRNLHISLATCNLKMGPTGCAETSVLNYLSTLRNIPEQCRTLHTAYYENERIKQLYLFLIRLMMSIYFSRNM
jgi:hypothetical protein